MPITIKKVHNPIEKQPAAANYLCTMHAVINHWIPLAIIAHVLVGLFLFFCHDKMPSSDNVEEDIIPGKSNTRFYLPLVPTLIFSVLITVIVYIFKHYYRRWKIQFALLLPIAE